MPALEDSAAHRSRFNAIAERHVDAAWRVARRFGVAHDEVADVVQEVFIIVSRKLEDIACEQERAFVVGTTVRIAANWRRTVRRRPEWSSADPEPSIETNAELPQEAFARRREGLCLLDAALARMTEAQRAVFVLTELEELTARQVALQLSLPEAAVVSRLRRAREVFKHFCEHWQQLPAIEFCEKKVCDA